MSSLFSKKFIKKFLSQPAAALIKMHIFYALMLVLHNILDITQNNPA